jgi:hypothetical protein
MQWNGTYLGKAGESPSFHVQILEKIQGKVGNYWRFKTKDNDIDTYALICYSDTHAPCFLDEVKPMFGLRKVGTHYCTYKNSFVILYRVLCRGMTIMEDVPLTSLKELVSENSRFSCEVCRLILFRYLFSISTSTQNRILVRTEGGVSYPISLTENKHEDGPNVLCDAVISNWFPDMNLDEICSQWLGINSLEEYHQWIFFLSKKLDETPDGNSLRWLLDNFRKRAGNLLNKML